VNLPQHYNEVRAGLRVSYGCGGMKLFNNAEIEQAQVGKLSWVILSQWALMRSGERNRDQRTRLCSLFLVLDVVNCPREQHGILLA
jgi:hypothetical protein